MRHLGRRHRRIQHQVVQFDLFGPPDSTLNAPMTPEWHQLPETARATATRLMARLLVAHGGRDQLPRSTEGHGHD